ncbi:hypothetical protein LCGC14_2371530 [marine sediment metagenome]|uniref:Uncharacterized protein n=1 Tax=marine sediment metagenome TaxID=412755 RepID=A0A0F9C3N9_9ZZZZ
MADSPGIHSRCLEEYVTKEQYETVGRYLIEYFNDFENKELTLREFFMMIRPLLIINGFTAEKMK